MTYEDYERREQRRQRAFAHWHSWLYHALASYDARASRIDTANAIAHRMGRD